MRDVIKAFLIGTVLITGVITAPIIAAVLAYVISFAFVVLVIWLLLQIFKGDTDPGGGNGHGGPGNRSP